MKRYDRREVCHAILRNVGVHDYCLVDAGHLIVPELGSASSLQVIAVRVAAAIWSGRVEPDVALVLRLI